MAETWKETRTSCNTPVVSLDDDFEWLPGVDPAAWKRVEEFREFDLT
jgi:hypothetical protein